MLQAVSLWQVWGLSTRLRRRLVSLTVTTRWSLVLLALVTYRLDILPTKRHAYQENCRINRWLMNDLCYRTLANLKGADFAQYRDLRRQAGRAENTIRLELQLINHLFEMARKEWGMENLTNPLNNIRKPSGSKAHDRRRTNRRLTT
jgi:hypothetical protein